MAAITSHGRVSRVSSRVPHVSTRVGVERGRTYPRTYIYMYNITETTTRQYHTRGIITQAGIDIPNTGNWE